MGGIKRYRSGAMLLPLLLSWPLDFSLGALLSPAGQRSQTGSAPFRRTMQLFAKDGEQKKAELTAAGQARRDEEQRRRKRRNDVVIGKTSALRDAKDFAVNPAETEKEWMRQASNVEQQVATETDRGMRALKMLKLEEANDAFDRVYELKPNAYLWQSGLARFYLGDLIGAAERFAQNGACYESRFGGPASEERIWRDACELKLLSGNKKLRAKREKGEPIVAQIPDPEQDGDESLGPEIRKVIRIARDLFSASVANDYSTMVLARAKLRCVCGDFNAQSTQADRKMWRSTSWYYLGLHYDVMGEDVEESKKCMKTALRMCPSAGKADDILQTLPLIHVATRDWYDDEEYVEIKETYANTRLSNSQSSFTSKKDGDTKLNPLMIESIRDSIESMRLVQMQDALRARGLKPVGSKDQLKDKLFKSLVEDMGLS